MKFAFKIFIVIWILWMLFVTVSTRLQPKAYASTARVKLGILGTMPSGEMLQSNIQTILSPLILNQVIKKLNLDERWGQRYFHEKALISSEALKILLVRLNVTPVTGSSEIAISSYSEMPNESAEIANAVADVFCAYTLENQKLASADVSSNGYPGTILAQPSDRAQPPLHPYKPNVPLNIILGMLFATVYGALAAGLAVGGRVLVKKFFVGKMDSSKRSEHFSTTIKQKY